MSKRTRSLDNKVLQLAITSVDTFGASDAEMKVRVKAMNRKDKNRITYEEISPEPEEIESGSLEAMRDERATPPQVIPVVEERVKIEGQKKVTSTVKIHKHVQEQTEVVNPKLQSEEVEIERVAVNRIVEEPVPIRYEGDTMIIPLLEEVVVVEKRLVLREEVHVRKVHKEVSAPQEVRLRKEEVEVERLPFSEEGLRQNDSTQSDRKPVG